MIDVINISEAVKNIWDLKNENPGFLAIHLWDEPCVQLTDKKFRERFMDFTVEREMSVEVDEEGSPCYEYRISRRYGGVKFFALSDHGKEGDDEVVEVES